MDRLSEFLMFLCLLTIIVSTAFVIPHKIEDAAKKTAPAASQPNYERMADCFAEASYVTQYQMTMSELQKTLRRCDIFTRTPEN